MGTDLTVEQPQNLYSTSYTFMGMPMNKFVGYKDWAERQFVSFDSVFSPTDAKQNPEPLFDRTTGRVDPSVAHYWEQHYDIAAILRERWSSIGPELRGKIHIFVGRSDNFHLDAPVALLKNELQQLGANAQIEIIPGYDHWSIFEAHQSIRRYIVEEAAAALAAANVSQ